ncbi:winged helix-turn-helix domain-containing protein [Alloacidobacterium dinghuense]|uniref:Winged helix-turn-helix domain-containing protein n=1 Tax=Alloacidobacterium dinghuense TaxID=2763107 RepID=A0A7G8BFT6_9BACT|nr:winged helix-turn-helix domain-containing protein [Alloacidobacterium dinghuense]QNI31406.1 winged helix-turn-helix domain-containing protein [Alloacidobacterium dinghuense]
MTPPIASKSLVFRFADVTVREREFAIVKSGQVQQVEPKAFRLLLIMIRNPNKLIAKEELLNSVWGETAVTENSLARNIALLRRLLGDDPREPLFIETVSGIGYRFICPVEVTEDPIETLQGTRGAETVPPNGSDADTVSAALLAQDSVEAAKGRTDAIATPSRSRGKWAVVAAAGFICVCLVFWQYTSRQSHSLTDKDSIVLAEFVNTTSDAIFDGTLRQGLAVQLGQSPFLNLVSDQRIQHTLSLMGQPPDAHLASNTARQLCQRIAAAAVVEGSIASLGSEYVIGLRALSCQTGEVLAEQQVQAARKEDVLKALSRASGQLRKKLGESLSTVERFDTPLEEATTSSLDALLAYTMGRRELNLHDNCQAAVPLFQRAIDLDPKFAMAHLSLGLSQINLGQTGLAAKSIRRAFELREHVSEWEKFAIESRYYFAVIGDLPKARQVYRLWAQIYPHERIPVGVLGQEVDPELGRYDDALADAREALARSQQNPEDYEGLVVAYMNLDQLENARATADEANGKRLEAMDLPQHLYHLAFLRKDSGKMAQEAAWAVGKPGVEDVLLSYEADTSAFSGQIEKAREFSQRAIASARQAGQKETAAGYQSESAIREGLYGNFAEARSQAEAALALSSARDVEARAAFALALARRPAERLAEDLARRFPEDTMVQFVFLPVIRAQLALNHRDAAHAIKELDASAPFELGNPSPYQTIPFALYPCYLRGIAFLASNQGKEAAVEFQKILDHPGIVISEPIGALAHKNLARAYTLMGQIDKAQASYREFMNLWHEADNRNPIFHEAKLEYRQLGAVK